MKILSSLRSRIFLASALLAVLCIGVAISLVNVTVTKEAERTLEREIIATGEQVDQLRAERTQTFTMMARLIADLPKLKAAMETNDPPTVQDIAERLPVPDAGQPADGDQYAPARCSMRPADRRAPPRSRRTSRPSATRSPAATA